MTKGLREKQMLLYIIKKTCKKLPDTFSCQCVKMLNTNSVPGICKHLKLMGKLYNYMNIAKIQLCLWKGFRGFVNFYKKLTGRLCNYTEIAKIQLCLWREEPNKINYKSQVIEEWMKYFLKMFSGAVSFLMVCPFEFLVTIRLLLFNISNVRMK